ncbi:MAG: tryptophan--tRNA ligase [Candidatus Peribacteraceae bacterium]
MRVLSGIQPSGQLHIGNYFGSIKPNLGYQGKADQSFFFIADLHALTTVQDGAALRKSREDIILDYLACGFDPDKSVLYYQSQIPEHTELMWILSVLTPMGLLERAVSYKEKVEKGITASAGLFTYPVLMAADILLYQANLVPVGKDQKQHLEMTRDIAVKFNNVFGETFTIPDPLIREEVAVVPGTDGQKMSKSYGNTIPLFGDDPSTGSGAAKKAIMGIVSDSKGANDPKDPDTSVIFQIHKLFLTPAEQKALAAEYRNGLPYGDAKKKLLDAYLDFFAPMRKKREEYVKKPDLVRSIVEEGAAKAKEVAEETMEKVRKAVGL